MEDGGDEIFYGYIASQAQDKDCEMNYTWQFVLNIKK